jgi:serine/threonine protein kinase
VFLSFMEYRVHLQQYFDDSENYIVHSRSLKVPEKDSTEFVSDCVIRVGRAAGNDIQIVTDEPASEDDKMYNVSKLHFWLTPGAQSPHQIILHCGTNRMVYVNGHPWKKGTATILSINDIISYRDKFKFMMVSPFTLGVSIKGNLVCYDKEKENFVLKLGPFILLQDGRVKPHQGFRSVETEVEILRNLPKHDNCINPECFYVHRDTSFHSLVLVTPRILGGNLAEFISLRSQVDIRPLICGILDGVRHLHQNGIIHGDLKPQNILIDTKLNNRPIICDFGSARKETDKTHGHGSTIGYVAPELPEYYPTKKTDIWALGCVCFYLFTREVPFETAEGLSQDQVDARIRRAPISEQNRRFLLTMLQEFPHNRANIEDIRY